MLDAGLLLQHMLDFVHLVMTAPAPSLRDGQSRDKGTQKIRVIRGQSIQQFSLWPAKK